MARSLKHEDISCVNIWGYDKGTKDRSHKKIYSKIPIRIILQGENVCYETVNIVGNQNFLLDSGAFSYMNGKHITKSNMDKYVKKYISFINQYDVKYFF